MQEGDTGDDISEKLAISVYGTNNKEKNKWENLGELQDNRSKGVPIAIHQIYNTINWHYCYLLLIQTKAYFI